MIDGHTHLENGELTKEYVHKFIQSAINNGIDHLHILDHTHRFFEFRDMYKKVCEADDQQRIWFENKQKNSIKEYQALIEEIKKEDLPIKVSFGLEVCYMPENESFLKDILNEYPYDFLVGSVHGIDGYLYDLRDLSPQILWKRMDKNTIYKRYYELLIQCIDSKLFTQIGHPDTIKMYQIYPDYDLSNTYKEVAIHAKNAKVMLEDNTGASYRYNYPEVGLHPAFRKTIKEYGVPIIYASDAHYPEDVGKNFNLLP